MVVVSVWSVREEEEEEDEILPYLEVRVEWRDG